MRQLTNLVAILTAFALGTVAQGQYVVGRIARGKLASEIANRHGAKLVGVTSNGQYVRLQMAAGASEADYEAVIKDSGFLLAERERSLRPIAISRPKMVQKGSTIPAVWGRQQWTAANEDLLRLVNWDATLVQSPGRQVRVAILDTGLAEVANELWGKVVASRNFVEPGTLALDRPTNTDCNGDGLRDEGTGHGTLIAGIVDLVSPKSQLVIARVANSDGYASNWSIIEGLLFAQQSGAEVVNISLADQQTDSVLAKLIEDLSRAGMTIIAAAGNENVNNVYSPASLKSVISVSALDVVGNKAPFSNYHPKIDVSAPGISVTGPYWNGSTIQWSGTSFASAFVTGTVADCMRRNGLVHPSKVSRGLNDSGRDVNDPRFGRKLGKLIEMKSLDHWLKLNP